MDRTPVRLAVIFSGLLLAVIIVFTFGPLPGWLLQYSHGGYSKLALSARISDESDLRGQLLQAVAGLLLIVGGIATWRQLVTASGQLSLNRAIRLTDAFTAALEQLGASDSLARRVGGIYALDRVAHDDPTEANRVVEILSAFVRQVPAQPIDSIGADVQQAVNVLLKLREGRANLDGARLRGAVLAGADLSAMSLRGAVLAGAILVGANLRNADLSGADLRGSELMGADLSNCNLEGADFRGTALDSSRDEGSPQLPSI
jgi:hypothetical protein